MAANRRRNTGPEMALRSTLHRLGLRFRVDYPIAVPTRRPARPDIAFTPVRVAVFVDGCFWHQCPDHGTAPASNREYWLPKLRMNVARDRRVDLLLAEADWTVVRVWEHEPPTEAAARVAACVRAIRNRCQSATATN